MIVVLREARGYIGPTRNSVTLAKPLVKRSLGLYPWDDFGAVLITKGTRLVSKYGKLTRTASEVLPQFNVSEQREQAIEIFVIHRIRQQIA